jgi:hypothetical protein
VTEEKKERENGIVYFLWSKQFDHSCILQKILAPSLKSLPAAIKMHSSSELKKRSKV